MKLKMNLVLRLHEYFSSFIALIYFSFFLEFSIEFFLIIIVENEKQNFKIDGGTLSNHEIK